MRLEFLEDRNLLAISPIAAYSFDEGAGSIVADASGTGNNGIVTAGSWVAGQYGNAISFNGVSTWVTVNDSNSLDLGTALTMEAWVKPATLSGWRTTILKEAPTGLAYALYSHDNAPRPAAYLNIAGDQEASGTTSLPLNTWSHLATTYDGANLRLYVNGTQVGSRPLSGLIATSSGPLRIGGNAPWGEYFSGLIDEVRIYDRALSASEIQSDMNTPVTDSTPPIVTSVSPLNSSLGVSTGASLTATFSEAVDPATISTPTFELRDASNNLVPATVSYNGASKTATLQPVSTLAQSTLYNARLKGNANGVKDVSGNALAADFTWSFTTSTPSLPSISINDVSVTEGNSGTVSATFTVTLSATSTQTVSVTYATANGSAVAGADYTAVSATVLQFAPGEISKNVSVTVTGDVVFEGSETFFINLSNPVNATVADGQGQGTVIDDDTALIGTEGFGYSATTYPFESINLVPGAAGVVTIRSTGDNNSNAITLSNGATFSFYGTNYTTLNVSTNGLIAFGSSTTSAANTDLTSSPSQRVIAPMWDDWINTTGNAILLSKYEDTNGDGVNDRLILEWNSVQGAPTSPSPVTFQAILQLNTGTTPGTITFNYPDLDAGSTRSNGGSATVGIKDTNTQGTKRLLVSFNSATNPYVSSGQAIRFTPDTTAPTVSMESPADGAEVMGTITVSASAGDNVGVAGVQFLLDGVALGAEDLAAPYSYSFNTTTATNGTHTFAAIARDATGNRTTSNLVTVVVTNIDPQAPTVSITNPTNNGTVSGTLTVTANAADNVGVVGVQFLLDGNNLGVEDTSSPYSVSWNTISSSNGSHSLTARARDAAGNSTTSTVVTVNVANAGGVPLTINGGQTFQTIDGFGVNVNAHSWNNGELRPALDLLHDQMGSTLYRVVYDMGDWEATNDNSDPNTPDWTYFNSVYSNASFQELWGTLGYLNQKGVVGAITLSFMGRVPTWMGGSVINTSLEDEWVETITTLVAYARNTANVQFSSLDPLNEPDWDGIEGPQVSAVQYTRLLHKLSVKLDSMGMQDIRLLGPNTASIDTGVNSYMPTMMGDPVVMSKVDHFALHNYAGYTAGAAGAISGSAYPTKNFWITEVTNPWDIMTHLAGNPSAVMVWDGFDSAYIHPTLHGASLSPPNDEGNGPAPLAYNSATGVYTPRKSFYQDQQIFKFVPPGSVRVSASESNGNLTVYAFYDQASSRVTIVGRNAGTSNILVSGSLSNLPTVTSFESYLTDSSNNFARLANVSVSSGAFSFSAPSDSFFTLTTLAIPDPTPPTVSVTAPAPESTITGTVTVTGDAADNVGVAGVQFLLDGSNLGGEDTTAPYAISWNSNTSLNGTHVITARARDAANNTTTSTSVFVSVNNVSDDVPPTVSLSSPADGAVISGTFVVTATASDNIGVTGVQFLLDGNNLGGEDTTAPYSISWDTTTTTNGTHVLTARVRDAANNMTTSASVTVAVSNVAPSSLVAAYGFNEGSGTTAADNSGNSLQGTLTNASWTAAGRFGNALSFNGTNAWVTIVDNSLLHLTTGMTLEAWVNPTTLSGWRSVLLKERTGALSYSLYATDPNHSPSAPAGFINTGGGDVDSWGSAALVLNSWTHLATTYDGAALRMYVNGTLVRSQAVTGNIVETSGALRIGGNSVWGEYFAGLVDEVRIYSRSLSQAEIQTDMNTPVGSPLRLLGDEIASSSMTPLSREGVDSLLNAALASWLPGLDDETARRLRAVRVEVIDLPGTTLGLASSTIIYLDTNAAGHGWFVDPTPWDDSEFAAVRSETAAEIRADLLSVLIHEYGHILGLDDHDAAEPNGPNVMADTLPLGVRRIPNQTALPRLLVPRNVPEIGDDLSQYHDRLTDLALVSLLGTMPDISANQPLDGTRGQADKRFIRRTAQRLQK